MQLFTLNSIRAHLPLFFSFIFEHTAQWESSSGHCGVGKTSSSNTVLSFSIFEANWSFLLLQPCGALVSSPIHHRLPCEVYTRTQLCIRHPLLEHMRRTHDSTVQLRRRWRKSHAFGCCMPLHTWVNQQPSPTFFTTSTNKAKSMCRSLKWAYSTSLFSNMEETNVSILMIGSSRQWDAPSRSNTVLSHGFPELPLSVILVDQLETITKRAPDIKEV